MKRLVVPVLLAVALAACATTPTVYQPAAGPSGVGYSELRIEPGRYRIIFRGARGASPELVSDYALLRAADLAIADGYDWFKIADRNAYTEAHGYGGYGPGVSVGVGGADYGRHSSTGVGIGANFMLGGGGPAYSQSMEVVMGRGEPPRDLDVYDAHEVRRNIGGRAGYAT